MLQPVLTDTMLQVNSNKIEKSGKARKFTDYFKQINYEINGNHKFSAKLDKSARWIRKTR